MKKYALFGYEFYYASGGVDDFIGFFSTKEELEKLVDTNKEDYYQIVDATTFKSIFESAVVEEIKQFTI